MPQKTLMGSLETYFKKRNFKITSEPRGKVHKSDTHRFVVQRHEASALHYDFRLEIGGVLKSWAVPKEPLMNPSVKRLAVQTEDHPIEYAEFHGDIPDGEYGAGHMEIWDAGTFKSLDGDAREAFENGKIVFELKGKRLKGRWTLVRTHMRGAKDSWLLMKAKDKFADFDSAAAGEGAPVTKVTATASGKRTQSARSTSENRASVTKRSREKSSSQKFEFTHPERVLFSEQGVTKQDLADYYKLVSYRMMPYVLKRPLALVRCPAGQASFCFFQKHYKEGMGPGLGEVTVPEVEGTDEHIQITSKEGLLSLVQNSTLEIHTWGAKAEDPESPDQIVFDMDPDPELGWKDVVEGCHRLHELLKDLGLKAFVKLSGSKGAHIQVPLKRGHTWEEVRAFSEEIARELERRHPERYTANSLKKKRKGRIYVDYLRNNRGTSFVAPYSTRKKAGATIAMPIEWKELTEKIKPTAFTVANAAKHLKKKDPWANYWKSAQKLPSLDLLSSEGMSSKRTASRGSSKVASARSMKKTAPQSRTRKVQRKKHAK